MKILIIGSGGREHALAWKLAQSTHVEALHCAPGNPGMAQLATCHDVSATDLTGLLELAKREGIHLTVVGPEAPLAAGIVDMFRREGLKIFGPTQRAAALESSKAFSKTFMQQYRIPTAHYGVFKQARDAKAFVARESLPIVIKADGLAAGKGVVIAKTQDEAEATIDAMLSGAAHGDAGACVVIEQFLTGEEISCIAIVDGERYTLMDCARDHKALRNNDEGPNTGGMGAYSPSQLWTPALEDRVRTTVIEPTIAGMRKEGREFSGFLYAGLMVVDGTPYVLEYNVRMGDPEAQAILCRLQSDLASVLHQSAAGKLDPQALQWDPRASCCVVMTAGGYPSAVTKGDTIDGLDAAATMRDVTVFHAGTKKDGHDVVTAGGRVLGVTALGDDLAQAQTKAYDVVRTISWDNVFYRNDIGYREL